MNILLIILLLVIVLILLWALFGKDVADVEPARSPEPEVLLRRRASDREIEESYPDDRKPLRRKSDMAELEKTGTVDEEFSLPFSTDEIIPENSGFRIYRRTIANAEIYAKKGDFATAISLYEGVNSRINDIETNHMIEADINYLTRYREHLLEKKKRRYSSDAPLEKKSREVKFSLDGPLTIPDNIQIGITAPPPAAVDINKIADEITLRLKKDRIIPDIDEKTGLSPDDVARKKELEKYAADLERLEKKIDTIAVPPVQEADRKPAIIEARYNSPVPVMIDPKPIIEILDKIPGIKGTGRGRRDDGTLPEGETAHGRKTRDETEELKTEFLKQEEDRHDEWDLMKNLDMEEDAPAEQMTDEDIFAKILTDDRKGDETKYEILGDSKEDHGPEYNIDDREFELKKREEEKFYEKFLQHHKRKKRELPILKVSYDFSKLPDEFSLAREKNILEYAYYKYKPMLERANEYIRNRKVKDAINYYKVVMSQNIPPEFKGMIRKNIGDLTEYLEKYLSSD